MKKRVKVGKYKTVFKGNIFQIKQAKAIFPSGKIKTFEKAVRPATVVILAIDNLGRLLLIHEYRLKQKRYMWRLPGGRVDKEKYPKRAAQRELSEETGLQAKIIKLFHLAEFGITLEWKRYAYLAYNLSPSFAKADEDEDITVVPTPITKAFKMAKDEKIENDFMAYLIMKLYFTMKKKRK